MCDTNRNFYTIAACNGVMVEVTVEVVAEVAAAGDDEYSRLKGGEG